MPEKVRIPQKRYDELVRHGKIMREYMKDHMENRRNMLFTSMESYPHEKDLKDHLQKMDIREALPYIVFYSRPDIYDREGDEELHRTQAFMQKIIDTYVDVIEDEDYERVEKITPGAWKSMSDEKRTECFEGMILYYTEGEFDSFLKDLGYQKFMNAYDYSQSMYKEGEECTKLVRDLKKIWDSVQNF